MESKKENSCKIKEAIDLLSAALVEKEEDDKSTFNQLPLSEAIGTCTKDSTRSTSSRQPSRALSACSKAL